MILDIISKTNLEPIINLNCAFYENCTLPKKNFLCNKFPEFTICPEYQAKKIKLKYGYPNF